jgi:CheY-like chemotaxis protein
MRSLHALIIDDSGLARKTIMQALDRSGLADFSYTEFADGADALEAAQGADVDLIFIDLHMPRMGGIEFLRQLRKRVRNGPPAIMITSEAHGDLLLSVMNDSRVDALLLKPLDADRLRKGLRPIIQTIAQKDGPSPVPNGECAAEAVQQSFLRTCQLELAPTREPGPAGSGPVIYGLFTLTGDVHWSVVLGLDGPVAEDVATRFGGYAMTLDHPDLGDAIAEITNITAGCLKRLLSERDLSISQSLPSVLRARDLYFLVQHNARATTDQVHFRTELGRIWVSISSGVNTGLLL